MAESTSTVLVSVPPMAAIMMEGVRATWVRFMRLNRSPATAPTHTRGRKATNTLAKPKGL